MYSLLLQSETEKGNRSARGGKSREKGQTLAESYFSAPPSKEGLRDDESLITIPKERKIPRRANPAERRRGGNDNIDRA